MQEQRARKILQALIQGFDPTSGEELPTGTVLQQAEVLRALLAGFGLIAVWPKVRLYPHRVISEQHARLKPAGFFAQL